jgi:hypothetical protein
MENSKLLEAANKAAITHILPYEMDFSIEDNLQGFFIKVSDKHSSWEWFEQVNLHNLPDNVKEQYLLCKVYAITVKVINKKFPL